MIEEFEGYRQFNPKILISGEPLYPPSIPLERHAPFPETRRSKQWMLEDDHKIKQK
jgi:hypothetical protein